MHKLHKLKEKAGELLKEFKGENFINGVGCLDKIGTLTSPLGKNILLITSLHIRDRESFDKIVNSLTRAGLRIIGHTMSSRPNSPKEDVLMMKEAILAVKPDCVVVASGGSGIDSAKAAIILSDLRGEVEDYFGTGNVTKRLKESGKMLHPIVAVQTASGSGAHLTKYSNITDFKTNQKKLIIDEAIIPPRSLFDYSLTKSMSPIFTCDGAFDGLSHCLESYYGAKQESFKKIEEIALTGIELLVAYLEKAVADPSDIEAREAIGLATDLGGYAIMVGGTNGGHLTSFSLVDVLSHGRACAMLNPYYTVFFSPSIQTQLKKLSALFQKYGTMEENTSGLSGKELGLAFAKAMVSFSKRVGFPTTLSEVPGITHNHIERALEAAKDPQLESKLKNMPVPLTKDKVDEYMGPILEAAMTGDFSIIKNLYQ